VDEALDPSVTPVGLKLIVSCVADGEMLDVKFTNPVNPFAAVTVTVYVVDDPREIVREVGVTARLKSGAGGGAVGVADRSFDCAPVPALLIAATL
jgi:hypothetical protein